MADEYSISAKITMDTSGYDSGVKKAQSASKKLSKSITDVVKGFGKSGLSGAITSAGLALGGIGLAVGTAVKAIKGMAKALGECAEAYKVQLQAERALDTAINNSPFVSGTASKALKDYASQMQKVSNLGDEEIIPQMTQLIATGRTEAEVMKIIATASDMSASGAMSFDQAVTQLNATLNGNIGRLGQQNAELKGLTEEELKSGKAVEILGEKYKGLAKATVDTKKQLQNAIGDLKETFGSVFENAMAPMRKFFTEIIQGWADARKAKQDYEQSTKDVAQGTGDIEDFQNVIAGKQKELEDLKADLNALLTDDWGFPVEEAIRIKNEEIEQAERELEILKAQLDNKIEQQEIAKKQAEEENKRIETEKTVADLKGEYLEKIAEQERKWKNIKAVTGEQVKNEEKLKFYQDSLVDLMTKAGGQITTNNQLYKDQMAIIQSLMTEEEKGKADISTWEDKLIAQQIERYQIMKDNELKSTDNASKQYEIEHKYGKLILDLKMQQIEREKEVELSKVANTENEEEARLRILEYYSEKERLLRLQNVVVVKQQNEQIKKNWKDALKDMLENTKASVSKIGAVFGKIAKTIGSAFGGIKNILTKVFDFNPDDALDGLLKIEDKILTFFVETVPKLPAFFKSALQSISVLLANIKLKIDSKKVKDFVTDFVRTLAQNLPVIIKTGAEITRDILVGLIQGISENASTIIDLMFMIAKEIIKILPDILIAIIKAIPSILGSLVSVVAEVVKEIAKWVANMIIDGINLLLDGISSVWTWIPGTKGIPHIPHFANGTDNAQRGLALVGEAGPELVRFNGGEKVLNNHNTQKALAGLGNSGNTFNVTFNNLQDTSAYAMMSQLRQYNRQMAINGVI